MSDNMTPKTFDSHINLLMEVIEKNEHIIAGSSSDEKMKPYAFNSRVVIAKDINFLEAVRKEIGGELIICKNIGPFLYFD